MSDIERRIESLGKRLGAFVATTKLRVTERGPLRVIHIRENVGGRIKGQAWRLLENTTKQKLKHLSALMERKRLIRKIRRYIDARYPNNPAAIQKANAILQDKGPINLIRVLAYADADSLVVGSPKFDAKLFDLVSQVGSRLVIGDTTYQKEWVSVTTGKPIEVQEDKTMGTVTKEAAVQRLAELKATKRCVELITNWINDQQKASTTKVSVPKATMNDIYKSGGKELIVDMFKIFYDEILNAPSSNYVQIERDPSRFPAKKGDPKHF